jgi:hypothetical protein
MEIFLTIVAVLFVMGLISSWSEDRPDARTQQRREAEERRRRIRDEARAEFVPDKPSKPSTDRPIIPTHGAKNRQAPQGERRPKPRTAEPARAPAKPRTRPRRPDKHDGDLFVERKPDIWTPEGESSASGLTITAISMSGGIFVDWDGFPVIITMRIFDISDGAEPERRYGIGCNLDGLHDESGFFEYVQELEIPYQATTLSDLPVGAIPDFALMLPKKGRRRVIVYVLIAPAHDPEGYFTFGSVEYDLDFERVGYLEWEDHALEQEEHLVRIFAAASAVDETIVRAEIDTIKEFFSTRYEGRDDAKKWKSRASAVLRSTVEDLSEKRTTPGRLLNAAAKAIRDADEPEVSRTAFEVAVRAVAADGVVNQKEERLLEKLASALDLDSDVVRELRDRNLRATMFEHAEDESILGMPSGLSDEQKRSWLSTEYGKWRGRASHSNPDVAAEATIRLERIAKLRTALN